MRRLLLLTMEKLQRWKEGRVKARYEYAASLFAEALENFSFAGKCRDFEVRFEMWHTAEKQYAALGYRTVGISDFSDYIRYRTPIALLHMRRMHGERVVLHSRIFQEKHGDLFDMDKLTLKSA